MSCTYRNPEHRPICDLGLYGGMPSAGRCIECIAHGENTADFARDHLESRAVERERILQWPVYLRPMKAFATTEDCGLGDIVARTIGPVGGDAFKIWFEKTFKRSCGCEQRQEWLNLKFPLR